MPLYRITAPNGQTYQIEGPPGASDADVARAVMAQYPDAGAPIAGAKPAPFSLSDTLVSAAQGALGGTKSTIEGVAGAGSSIGETLEGAQKWLGSKLSPERQAEQQRRALLEKRAAETGKPLEEVAAGLGGIKEAPVQSIAQGVGSSLPTVLAGVGAAALGTTVGAPVAVAAAVGIGVKYLLGALQGAGEVKGSIYDAVKERLQASGMPETQAKQQAIAAQDYLGKNWDTIAAGAGIGAIAGGTGVESELLKKMSKTVAAKTTAKAAEKGALREFGEAAAKEGLGEGIQGGQGQAAENVALTREGFKTDVMKGVYGAAARDAALGALTGSAVHPFTGRAETQPQTPPPAPENKGAQLPPEAPAGTQGKLFTEEEMGKPVPSPAAPAAPTAEEKVPEGQMDLGLDYARQTGDVTKELERLKQQEQTPEVKARIAQLEEDLQTYSQLEVERLRSEKQDAEAQARADRAGQVNFPALANAPELMAQPDEVKARTQGELFPGEDLGTAPAAGPIAEPTLRSKKEAGPTQMPLGLRRNPEGQPTTFGQPEPTITSEDVMMTAVPIRKGMESWIDKNVIGSTRTQLLELIKRDPKLVQGSDQRAKLLRSLTAAEVPAFKEAPNVTPTQSTETKPAAEPRTGEPSVGVSGQPAAPIVPQPRARVPRAAAAPSAPVGRGLVPAGQPAGKGNEAQVGEPAAVNPFAALTKSEAPTLQEEAPAAPAKPKSPWDITGPSLHTKDQTSKGTRYAAGTDTGRSVQDLSNEIEAATGPNADALRAMLKSGKVKLEERHPTMKGVRGLFDGKTVTLYSSGIPEGNALSTALHEVGAHLGMAKLLGQKQYDAVISKILDWMQLKDGSLQAQLAQAAYRKIPIRDMKRGPEVFGDEAVAYFVEELAAAEAAGKLPKIGPLRAMWNQIKLAITTKLNKLLGTSFGLNDLTPQQIGMMADAAMQRESKTGVDETASAEKQQFASNYTADDVVKAMGPLSAEDRAMMEGGFKGMHAGMQDAVEPSRGTKFRTLNIDSAAAIEEKFSREFGGAVRNSLGKLNPMGLYRQAQDYAKLLLSYFQQGTLVKDPATGLYSVTKADTAPSQVFDMVYAWGEKTGRSKKDAEQFASRVLEAYRLDQVLKANPDFPQHMTASDRAILVAEYHSDPAFAAMNEAMDKPRRALVDQLVAVGRISKEMGEEWKSVVGYVPFDRIEDFSKKFALAKKTGGRSPLALTKDPELKGSFTRPVGNVFENYINTMGWMVGQIMVNDARVQTLTALQTAGFASKPSRVKAEGDRTGEAYVNGEKMYWELPSKYDAMAFQDFNPPKMQIFRTLGAFSNILRTSVTALPPFALKQVTDDVQRAIMTSGVRNPGALLRMSLANFGSLAFHEVKQLGRELVGLKGIEHPMVRDAAALGMTGEYDFQQGKPALSLLKDLGHRERKLLGSTKFGILMHRLEGITRASDLAVRQAIYQQTLNETNNDQLLAQTRAREFINFRRRGASEWANVATTTIPFFNAYVQGMDVLYRAASGKDSSSSIGRAEARRMFRNRALVATILASLYAVGKGDDDDDYKEMDLRTRNGNWILPGGFKIPVPGELGAIFKVIPETVVEYLKRSGTPEEQTAWEATRTALMYAWEQYGGRVTPVPQAVKPLLEAVTNHSFLTGRELEGLHHKTMDPSMRRNDQTSELAQAIANFSRDVVGVDAVSPILVDNMLNGYFGSTAALVTATTDSLLNPTRVDRPLHKWALLSNYMYDPVGTRRMTEFYEAREEVGKANATLKELLKTDMDRAAAYAESHQDELMLESSVNSTLEQLERTRAYRKFLNSPDGAKEMSADQREKELQEIKRMEVELVGWVREAKAELRKLQ